VNPTPRFWSAEAWRGLATKIVAMAHGHGETRLNFETHWTGNVRWARNRISTSGDQRNNTLTIGRSLHSDGQYLTLNQLDDMALQTAMTYLDDIIAQYRREHLRTWEEPPFRTEDYLHPSLWFDRTYDLDGAARAAAAQRAIQPAEHAGMVSAGYVEVTARGVAVDRLGLMMQLYYPVTEAQFSVTVRDPEGIGSGWAGVSWNDWARIDVAQLSAIALDKCLKSRNPVAIEPGHYTTILEPQAVYALTSALVNQSLLSWPGAIARADNPYHDPAKAIKTKLGTRMLDKRLTIRADPMDPELGFLPFTENGEPYHAAVWFEHGVLTQLPYGREFAINQGLGNLGLPNSENYRLDGSGPLVSVDEMIASTTRGVLVTRFSQIEMLDRRSLLLAGYTRDGVWLIENGKIRTPVKNFRFTESPLFALNNIDQIGVSQRVFCPGQAVVVPPLKIRDFAFTSLSDGV
jgi:predicted Zn-dependent protease